MLEIGAIVAALVCVPHYACGLSLEEQTVSYICSALIVLAPCAVAQSVASVRAQAPRTQLLGLLALETLRLCVGTTLWLAVAVIFGLDLHRCVPARARVPHCSRDIAPLTTFAPTSHLPRSAMEPRTVAWALLQTVLTLPRSATRFAARSRGASASRRFALLLLGEHAADEDGAAAERDAAWARSFRSIGGILGAWLGAVPIPLDWHVAWQVWPVSVVWGGVLGAGAGVVVGGAAARWPRLYRVLLPWVAATKRRQR